MRPVPPLDTRYQSALPVRRTALRDQIGTARSAERCPPRVPPTPPGAAGDDDATGREVVAIRCAPVVFAHVGLTVAASTGARATTAELGVGDARPGTRRRGADDLDAPGRVRHRTRRVRTPGRSAQPQRQQRDATPLIHAPVGPTGESNHGCGHAPGEVVGGWIPGALRDLPLGSAAACRRGAHRSTEANTGLPSTGTMGLRLNRQKRAQRLTATAVNPAQSPHHSPTAPHPKPNARNTPSGNPTR